VGSGKTDSNTNKAKEHNNNNNNNKGQPILPEVGQYVIDPNTGTKYLRGRLMGKGGFARCYEVTDVKLDQKLACKAISKARISKPHQQQKIANEVELHSGLSGYYIVRFYGYFEDEENVYILLELCSRKVTKR
jgi:serine/threonine protein kinase